MNMFQMVPTLHDELKRYLTHYSYGIIEYTFLIENNS